MADEPARVRLSLHDGKALIGLTRSLTRERFMTFGQACSSVGIHYRNGCRQADLHAVPRLVQSLEQAGFAVDVASQLADAACRRAHEIRADVAAAGTRMDAINLALQARGQSLFPYQREGVGRLIQSPALLLGDAMGVGKTVQALMAFPPGARVLVVCPAIMKGMIVDGAPRGGWASETRSWRPDFGITLLSGRGSFRWPRENEVLVTNFDILPPTAAEVAEERIKAEKKRKKGQEAKESLPPAAGPCPEQVFLVVDEIQAFGNPESKRTQRLMLLGRMVREAGGRTWGLSGTPLMNDPEELWSVLDVLGLATLAFGSWANYMRLYDAHRVKMSERRWQILWGAPSPEVAQRLRTVMLRRTKADVMDQLPARVVRTVVVDVGKEAMRTCESALAELAHAGIDLDAALAIADSATNQVVFALVSKVRKALAEAKAPHALELARFYEESQTPVCFFSAHLAVPALFQPRPGWGTVTGEGGTICKEAGVVTKVGKAEVAVAVREGAISNVAGTIQAMGTGLDGLQKRISHLVFVDKLWTPGANDQALSRAERMGQESDRITITSMLANHVLDHRVDQVLARKEELFAAVVDAASTKPGDRLAAASDLASELDRLARLVPPPWRRT